MSRPSPTPSDEKLVVVLPIQGFFMSSPHLHPSDEKLEEWYYPSIEFLYI